MARSYSMKKFLSLGLVVLMAGCATPTVTPKKPTPPLPPMPAGYKPGKAKSTLKAPVALLSTPRTLYTPGMTNVLNIRSSYTNVVVWGRLSKTNQQMGWVTNKVTSGIVVSYPTNAWDYALQWSTNLTSRWCNVRFNATNTNWRTTNGQWFDVTRPIGPDALTVYRLSKAAYAIRLIWDAHPQSNELSGFKVYTGLSSRNYTAAQYIKNLDAFNERRNGSGNGCVVTNLAVNNRYYFAVTAVGIDELESDFSNEVVLNSAIE